MVRFRKGWRVDGRLYKMGDNNEAKRRKQNDNGPSPLLEPDIGDGEEEQSSSSLAALHRGVTDSLPVA